MYSATHVRQPGETFDQFMARMAADVKRTHDTAFADAGNGWLTRIFYHPRRDKTVRDLVRASDGFCIV